MPHDKATPAGVATAAEHNGVAVGHADKLRPFVEMLFDKLNDDPSCEKLETRLAVMLAARQFDQSTEAAAFAERLRAVNDGEFPPAKVAEQAFDEYRRGLGRELAAALLSADRADDQPLPKVSTLTALLLEPDDPVHYRIGLVLPAGGRALLYAPRKTGKSTLVGNLQRSLVDGDPFLGEYDVELPDGKVTVIDDELSRPQHRRWLSDQGIVNTDRLNVVTLRGHVSRFNILDARVRREWAAMLSDCGTAVVILDCLRPVLDALGLSEDKDAGRFLVAFDELLADAGATEAIVVHHAGHSNERARGDSRLMDWPDALWKLAAEKVDDPFAARYFSALGRDVAEPEQRLSYDVPTRRLSIVAGGSRRDAALTLAADVVVEVVGRSDDRLSGRSIEQRSYAVAKERGLEVTQKRIREAVEHLRITGRLDMIEGARNAKLYAVAAENEALI
ncbi:AAA family ATPase [Williamsia sp. 1135]|uniref:AAA family ATPase n=1 Tax=Williamsia sp. 1135 TaxID=1889262 RepID=UPI000A103A4B|nr:AAA family ATPase [Williamsia sp. 1135]ORM37953.1 hypothetical protein BFL43_02140 [Williamsia sp. 1135]